MRKGTYYLNNSGSKWIVYPKEKFILIDELTGYRKIRTVEYYESFGNFALCVVKYNGKRKGFFPDERDEKTGMIICKVYHPAK